MKMNPTRRSPRLFAALALALVAGVGALTGVVADRAVVRADPAPLMAEGAEARCPDGRSHHAESDRYRERLAETLDLSPEQQRNIDAILERRQEQMHGITKDMRPRMRAVMREARDEIMAELSADQQEALQEMHRRDRAERRERESRDGTQP